MRPGRVAVVIAAIALPAFILMLNRNFTAGLVTAIGGAAIAIVLVGCCAIPLLLSLFGIRHREGGR
jgi:hypothetical protein